MRQVVPQNHTSDLLLGLVGLVGLVPGHKSYFSGGMRARFFVRAKKCAKGVARASLYFLEPVPPVPHRKKDRLSWGDDGTGLKIQLVPLVP